MKTRRWPTTGRGTAGAAAANRPMRGFTLVELLIVIAIISLLAAMLLPVLGEAREQARQAACQSNLKQWGIAFNLYFQDCNNEFPRTRVLVAPPSTWSSPLKNQDHWGGVLAKAELGLTLPAPGSYIFPHNVPAATVAICPTIHGKMWSYAGFGISVQRWRLHNHAISYAANAAWAHDMITRGRSNPPASRGLIFPFCSISDRIAPGINSVTTTPPSPTRTERTISTSRPAHIWARVISAVFLVSGTAIPLCPSPAQ